MTLTPRPAQRTMLAGLGRNSARHQLVGSMGLGKSGAVLCHAARMEFTTGKWPGVCILAPLQVAFNWRREIEAWLPGKRWSLVAGTAAQRQAALKADADIYLLTYDNLGWLHEYHPGAWSAFGQLMVCDESQRIKNARVSYQKSSTGKVWLQTHHSGAQTGALATHAADFAYWVNATGSLRPQGLEDLWGQYWFLDAGARLGRSFTSFEERWFRKPTRGGDFAKPLPMPGAEAEIISLTQDITTVARVEDFYDLAEPNVIDRTVELPAKARSIYSSIKNTLAAELGGGKTVTAPTAASKITKLRAVSSGFVYHTDDEDPDVRLCEFIHDAKANAVDSILKETGESLVVVYHFKAALEILQKKFKKRLHVLDDKGKAQDNWNAGRIEILAIQYERGSLGLSLQHGGRNICLVEPTYRGDSYAQIIERLGPMRQKQSGYNRTVNVFRILAEGTEDKRVFDVATGKITREQAYYEMLAELSKAT
jgi:SNF2 family DNA or RNA helicase